MKICSRCKKSKGLSSYTKNSKSSDGYRSACKACTPKRKYERKTTNKSKYIFEKPEYMYRPEHTIRYPSVEYYKESRRLSGANYRARKKFAQPNWVNQDDLAQIYEDCPKGMEVDHIIPLAGKNSCGLHVPWNLQYLSKSDNSSKGNTESDDVTDYFHPDAWERVFGGRTIED